LDAGGAKLGSPEPGRMSPLPTITAKAVASPPASERELPLVSVVTPSYNQGAFLEGTIQSVLNQDYLKVEYLIMDGGSTDGSLDIIRRYAGQLAYWESGPDRGQVDAINRGFARSTGDVLAWLNSDDRYEPGALWEAVSTLLAYPQAGMVYGIGAMVDPQGKVLGLKGAPFDAAASLVRYNTLIVQPAAFIRREVLVGVGWLDPGFEYLFDWDLWLRISLASSMVFVPRVWARALVHPDAKTERNVGPDMGREYDLMVARLYAREPLPIELLHVRPRVSAIVDAWRARSSLLRGRRGAALRWAGRSVRKHPGIVFTPWAQMLLAPLIGTQVSSLLARGVRGLRRFARSASSLDAH
jgi:glycosyltransferase involved in cell wall biosynthesis